MHTNNQTITQLICFSLLQVLSVNLHHNIKRLDRCVTILAQIRKASTTQGQTVSQRMETWSGEKNHDAMQINFPISFVGISHIQVSYL